MRKRVLFGTANQTKRDRFQKLLDPLGLDVVSLQDLRITQRAREDGKTPEENATKKAKFYFDIAHIPTFAVDYGLYIDKFPAEKQPGLFVRRIVGVNREVTDEDLLAYYLKELKEVGGESGGQWVSTIVLVVVDGKVFSQDVAHKKTLFVSTPSPVILAGEPLSSIQFDSTLKKYYSEMTSEERAGSQAFMEEAYREFIRQHLPEL